MFDFWKKKEPVVKIVGHPVRVNSLDTGNRINRARARVERLEYAIHKHGAEKVPQLVAERDVLIAELSKLREVANKGNE